MIKTYKSLQLINIFRIIKKLLKENDYFWFKYLINLI